MRSAPRPLHALALACALLLHAGAVSAGNFAINPIRLDLSVRESEGVITVRNLDAQPVIVQVRTVAWSIRDNREVYEPTRDFIAAPLIFTLPAEGEQVVRIGLRTSAPPLAEMPYRVFLSEVPTPNQPGQPNAVQMLLNVGIPLFVRPAAPVAAALTWRAERTGAVVRVTVVNSGAAHGRVTRIVVRDGAGAVLHDAETNTYVLPGSQRWWETAAGSARQVAIEATVDGKPFTQTLDVVVP